MSYRPHWCNYHYLWLSYKPCLQWCTLNWRFVHFGYHHKQPCNKEWHFDQQQFSNIGGHQHGAIISSSFSLDSSLIAQISYAFLMERVFLLTIGLKMPKIMTLKTFLSFQPFRWLTSNSLTPTRAWTYRGRESILMWVEGLLVREVWKDFLL